MKIDHESMKGDSVRLGLAERWIIAGAAFILTMGIGWSVSFVASINKSQNDMATQLAVANAQLSAIRSQLSSVPQNTQNIAEMKVQVKRNSRDIHELQQVRGLK